MSPFLAWGDFHACSRFVRSTIPEEKWGTTRSLPANQASGCPVVRLAVERAALGKSLHDNMAA